jgi:O-acetyl-ADP-ribose deacetylase (regulator of RNase III)
MRKINHTFKGKHIGLPQIGCGLAGGDWSRVKEIIKKELKDCKVTVVIFKK